MELVGSSLWGIRLLRLCMFAAVFAVLYALLPGVLHASEKPRVFVLTDIGGDPDDAESLVRFLLYTNQFDVEGLAATSSRHRRGGIFPQKIEERVRAYGAVLPNLRQHAEGFPSMEYLLDRIVAGNPDYGMVGVGAGKDTDASNRIIAVVDRAGDDRPVWIPIWGGAVDLAQALWTVRNTRTEEETARFVSKLRVYSISDQDDAGPWIRREFPKIWWIVSLHAHRRYAQATWAGISGEGMYHFDLGGPDSSLVSNEWLKLHVRKGPLGSLYPRWEFIMEGDSPSFMYLIQNGLNYPDQPGYGGWGGRYERIAAYGNEFLSIDNIYTDTEDWVHGISGRFFKSRYATIWRWREAYQHDFAARIDWTLADAFEKANHNPVVMLNETDGFEPVVITAKPGDTIRVSAKGTNDPDGDRIIYHWYQYNSAGVVNPTKDAHIHAPDQQETQITLPNRVSSYHFVLEVKDNREMPLSAYRRLIVNVRDQ